MKLSTVIKYFNRTKDIALKSPQGFTYRLRRNKLIKSGYVCAYKATQNSFNNKGLAKSIEHALSHAGIVGGWFKAETNEYFYDSVQVLKSLNYAILTMVLEEQDAIYCMTEKCEIYHSQVFEIFKKSGQRALTTYEFKVGADKELIATIDGEVFTAKQPKQ